MTPAQSVQIAFRLLLQAHEYTRELSSEAWNFAIEIATLREAGLTNSDIRWLIHHGYMEHAWEITTLHDDQRLFQQHGTALLSAQSCFILTPNGATFGRSLFSQQTQVSPISPPPNPPPTSNGLVTSIPFWDKDRRSLRFGGQLVKQFKVAAQNQEIILAAFEEERWPPRIDDPLPIQCNIDPKRRLHDTINSLNRNQKASLLHFLGDGSGQAVRWEPACSMPGGPITAPVSADASRASASS